MRELRLVVGAVPVMLSCSVLLVIAVGLAVSSSAHSENQHESAGQRGREKSDRIDFGDSFDVRSVPRRQNREFESINDWLEIQDNENTNFRSQRDSAFNKKGAFESWELGYPGNVDDKMVDTSYAFGMSTNAEEQGASSKVTDCVTAIAKTGLKRAFPGCKSDISKARKVCKRPSSNDVKDCKAMLTSISLATTECDLEAEQRKPARDICKTISQPKKSKANCKPGQLFGQIPGSSSTPVCFDAPQSTWSKTHQLPFYLYPKPNLNSVEIQKLTIGESAVINVHSPENTNAVEIHTIPIGQGDCTVIYCPNEKHAILFDCGAKYKNGLSPLQIREYFFSNVDSISILISHGHEDHYNYIPAIFDKDESPSIVDNIIEVIIGGPESDYTCKRQRDYSCKRLRDWLVMIKNRNQGKPDVVKFLTDSKLHPLSLCEETKIEFHAIVGDSKVLKAKNERGMVMKLICPSCKGTNDTPPRPASLLFAGDMEGLGTAKRPGTATRLARSFPGFLHSTHYKMAHHGASSLANHEDWLKAIKPVEVHISHKYVVNRYKHPRCVAIDRLMGLQTVGTTAGAIGGAGHMFTCYHDNGRHNDQTIRHRLYSTAPRANMICYIKLVFTLPSAPTIPSAPTTPSQATTQYFCGATPEQLYPDLDDSDDEGEDD